MVWGTGRNNQGEMRFGEKKRDVSEKEKEKRLEKECARKATRRRLWSALGDEEVVRLDASEGSKAERMASSY